MLTPYIQPLGTLPTAHGTSFAGPHCGHSTHVGTCASCQRRQMAKWAAQLKQAQAQGGSRTS
jgi:hypothetical protein